MSINKICNVLSRSKSLNWQKFASTKCFNSSSGFKFRLSSVGSSRGMASSTTKEEATEKKNRLQYEKSPYLLQHQANPVDWYPWSTEAFALAKSKNLPIFLSVGYSTCHWCHVMERESFENPDIAKVMNERFINIKMDREERPDIDKIYMTFVQAISGSGGWPMSVWMTPDLKPIYGGTYYPPDNRYFGRPGFKALLETISDQWRDNEEKCHESAAKILDVLNRSASLPSTTPIASAETSSSKCIQQLTRSYEPSLGGFSEQPKFPQPVNLLFLMDWVVKNDDDPSKYSVVKMVETTLTEMYKGGIHDHMGQGFARYSTDKKWHVPHFEKMLYDQAQLTVAYVNAYLLTGNELYAEVARDILTYVDRDLSHPQGGFYSAEDADSYPKFDSKEKKEGAFYVWKNEEIDEIVGSKPISNGKATASELFKARFGVKDKGNVDPYNDPHDELKEQNVLFQARTVADLAKTFGIPEAEVNSLLEEARIALFNYRNINRPRPGLDTKVVTSWNGLMISGFARAGIALKSQAYIDRAVKAMDFLEKQVIKSDMGFDLLRSCYKGDTEDSVVNLQSPIFGCVDDFSNLVGASLDCYEATFNPKFLSLALKLQAKQDELFWDEGLGGYFTSRAGDAAVIVRMKDDDDGAEPSSNSTSVINIIRLHSFTGDAKYADTCQGLLKQFSDRLSKVPITLPVMTAALSSYVQGPLVVTFTGKDVISQRQSESFKPSIYPIGTAVLGIDAGEETHAKELGKLCPRVKDVKVEGDTIQLIQKREVANF